MALPDWLDVSLRVAAAIVLIGGIMWLAFRRIPNRDRDKGEPTDHGLLGGSDGGSGDGGSGHGGS